VKIRGKLRAESKRKREQIERKASNEGKRGWNRKEKGREEAWKSLENLAAKRMLKWRKALEERKERDCEKIWESWLETHNKVAENTIGRTLKPKKRHWKGKADPKISRLGEKWERQEVKKERKL
jgi:hypothetical protein